MKAEIVLIIGPSKTMKIIDFIPYFREKFFATYI